MVGWFEVPPAVRQMFEPAAFPTCLLQDDGGYYYGEPLSISSSFSLLSSNCCPRPSQPGWRCCATWQPACASTLIPATYACLIPPPPPPPPPPAGFPADEHGIKIGKYNHRHEAVTADSVGRAVDSEDEQVLRECLRRFFPAAAEGRLTRATACTFTNTPGGRWGAGSMGAWHGVAAAQMAAVCRKCALPVCPWGAAPWRSLVRPTSPLCCCVPLVCAHPPYFCVSSLAEQTLTSFWTVTRAGPRCAALCSAAL